MPLNPITPLLWKTRSLSGNIGSPEGIKPGNGWGTGRQRDDLLNSSVRPNGNASVPKGNPSVPAARPYYFTEFERIEDKDGNPTKFVKAEGVSHGEQDYVWEVQEDLENKRVWCHCNCPDFTYRFEVIDAGSGFSGIRNSNGAYPVKTNPNGVPSLCKHLESVLQDPQFDQAEREYQDEQRGF